MKFWNTELSEYCSLQIPNCRNTGTGNAELTECWNLGRLNRRNTGIWYYRIVGVQEFRNTELTDYWNLEILNCRSTGIWNTEWTGKKKVLEFGDTELKEYKILDL